MASLVSGVDGHEIDPVFGMDADHVEEVVHRDAADVLAVPGHRIVDRDRADHHRTGGDQPPPEAPGVATGAEIHQGVGLEVEGEADLGHLRLDVAAVFRDPEVDVDLGGEPGTDGPGPQIGMIAVGGDGDGPGRDPFEQLGLADRFVGQHLPHLFGDKALAGGGHLGGGGHGQISCRERMIGVQGWVGEGAGLLQDGAQAADGGGDVGRPDDGGHQTDGCRPVAHHLGKVVLLDPADGDDRDAYPVTDGRQPRRPRNMGDRLAAGRIHGAETDVVGPLLFGLNGLIQVVSRFADDLARPQKLTRGGNAAVVLS